MHKHMPKLIAVMTPFPYQIDESASIAKGQTEMRKHNIRHLLVVRDQDVVGIVSDRDLDRAYIHGGSDTADQLQIGDVCPQRVYLADANDHLDVVLEAMVEKKLGSIVVTKEGEPMGIFTAVDACQHFAEYLREQFSEDKQPPSAA